MNGAAIENFTSLDQALELIVSQQKTIERLESEGSLLRRKMDALLARFFGGRKNEALDPSQLELLLQGLEPTPPTPEPKQPPAPARRNKPRQPTLPADLETQEIVLEPEELKESAEGWRKIGEERTKELEWIPARLFQRIYIRPKYVKGEQIVIAPLPNRLIDKGLPGPGLLTHVTLSKFEDHTPLYRQEKIFWERYRVRLCRQTLGGWIEQVALWLKPIFQEMKSALMKSGYIQADETPIRYLDPDVKGKSQKGFLWIYSRPGKDVIFDWQTSRRRAGPQEFLKEFTGKIQTDGYQVYPSLCRENPH
jgi:transposase